MNKLLFNFLLFIFICTGCTKDYYLNSNFKKISANHQTIAILPVEMILTGQMPEGVEEADIETLQEAESKAFQKSLYNQIHQSPVNSKALRVSFQTVETTNALLHNQKISTQRSWKMTEKELARLLNVNAVIKTRVEKQRYMSDLASRGISIGKRLASTLPRLNSVITQIGMGRNLEKTSDIKTSCAIVNGKDGDTLWSTNLTSLTDWQRPSFEVIDRINRRMARDMPYRAN